VATVGGDEVDEVFFAGGGGRAKVGGRATGRLEYIFEAGS